jgi:hypothetical protein
LLSFCADQQGGPPSAEERMALAARRRHCSR